MRRRLGRLGALVAGSLVTSSGTSAHAQTLRDAAVPATREDESRRGHEPAEEPAGAAASPAEPPVDNIVIARMAENPLAGVFRVPLVSQTSFGVGPNDQVSHALSLAPIIPIVLPGGWGFIHRAVLPLVTAPDVAAGSGSTTGLGDTTLEVLGHKMFRGRGRSTFDLVAGPAFGFPSATSDALGTGKWLVGPEVGGAASVGMFVGGVLVRNLTSFAGDASRPDSNRLFLETFFFLNLPHLWYLATEPQVVVNWENSEGNRWTVPVGGGFGRHFWLPHVPWLAFTTRVQAFYNVVRPDNLARGEIGPAWTLRFNLVFFHPNPLVLDG